MTQAWPVATMVCSGDTKQPRCILDECPGVLKQGLLADVDGTKWGSSPVYVLEKMEEEDIMEEMNCICEKCNSKPYWAVTEEVCASDEIKAVQAAVVESSSIVIGLGAVALLTQ